MTKLDDVARSLNSVGLAAWFGGSLMGSVALRAGSPEALRIEGDVWRRWSTVQNAAVLAHLVGSARLAAANKGRLIGQAGVARVAAVKTACTVGAVGATVYASMLGREVHRRLEATQTGGSQATGSESSESDGVVSTGPSTDARGDLGALDDEMSAMLQRLRAVQTAVPLLTGAMLVADARLGEQQRPMEVLRGVAARAIPDALQALPESIQALPHTLQHSLQHSAPVEAVSSAAKHLPEVVLSIPDRRHS